MKKLLLTLMLSIPLFLFSQEFNGGFNAGFTASQVDGDGYGGFDKTGFTLGVFTNRSMSDKLIIQLELLYAQRGSKKNMQPEKNDYSYYKMHLDFMEVPLLAIYKYSETLSFEGGLSGVVLFRNYEENETGRFDSNPFYRYGLSSVIGIRYTLTDRLVLDLRETYSLAPIRGYAENGRWWYKIGQFSNSLSFTVNYLL